MRGKKESSWRVLSLLLAILAVGILAGCGDDKEKEVAKDEKDKSADVADNFLTKSRWEPEIAESTELVTIVDVIDGDKIVVQGEDGKEETVQLAAIQSPDYRLEDGQLDGAYGLKAYEYTNSMNDSNVRLERADVQDNKEGHTVGYIWVDMKPNITLNEMLLQDGLAKLDATDQDAKYLDEYRKAEAAAKADKKDIWELDGYVTSDGFNQSM